MRRLRSIMTWSSWVRYMIWRLTHDQRPVQIQLTSGEKFFVRPHPATDLAVASELFLAEAYRIPIQVRLPAEPELIVDAGANIGLSLVYFAARFPGASFVLIEPIPDHLDMIRRQVQLNRFETRVRVVGAAASNTSSEGVMTVNGSQSELVRFPGAEGCRVEVLDLFDMLAGRRIDVLKMDIEGGEYSILSDARFAQLAPAVVVLEWHQSPGLDNPKAWCRERLEGFGYSVAEGEYDQGVAGMLWGWK